MAGSVASEDVTRSAASELRRGWPALSAATLGVATCPSSLSFYTYGVFAVALGHELGWSRADMALVTLLFGLGLAVGAPVAGWAVDRFGARVPVAVTAVTAIVGYLALGALGGSFATFLALHVLIGFVGAGASPVGYTRVVNERFSRMRGLALGCALAGAGVMGFAAPPIIARIVGEVGWRGGYQALAAVSAASAALVLALLKLDGRERIASSGLAGVRAAPPGTAITLRAALAVPLFLRLTVAFVLLAAGLGGLSLHLVPLLTDRGFSLVRAAEVQGAMGLAIFAGRLGSGYLVDRFFAPWVGAYGMIAGAAGLVGLVTLGQGAALPCAMLAGMAQGSEGDLIGYLTARYFGLASYGRLYGVLVGLYTAALSVSPMLVALIAAHFGGYVPALSVCAALVVVAAAMLATLPPFPAANLNGKGVE